MSRMPRGGGGVCAIRSALALTLAAGTASAVLAAGEWADHYARGQREIEAGRAAEGLSEIDAALAGRPQPGLLRVPGGGVVEYTPHFWRGVAHAAQDECASVREDFRQSLLAGEVRVAPSIVARMRTLVAGCGARAKTAERNNGTAPAMNPRAALNDAALPDAPVGSASSHPADPPGKGSGERRALIERGMDEYLTGRFELAAATFRELAQTAPQSAGAHLLVGTALHAAYELGGQTDESLLDEAQRELALAARLNPELRPDPQMFSPRLIALFDRAR